MFRRKSKKRSMATARRTLIFLRNTHTALSAKPGTYLPDQMGIKVKSWSFLQEDKPQITSFILLPFIFIQMSPPPPAQLAGSRCHGCKQTAPCFDVGRWPSPACSPQRLIFTSLEVQRVTKKSTKPSRMWFKKCLSLGKIPLIFTANTFLE